MTTRRLLLMASASLFAAGCGGGPPPPPMVEMSIRTGADANVNNAGTPVSVAVRLYSLTARGRFMSADAYALLDRERAVLGDESAGSEEFVMRPGETRNVSLAPKAGVRYVGVAVLFRDIDRAQWRAVAPVAPSGMTRLALAIGANKAVLEQA
jgi:type VI secretion system protein VasD